MRCSTDSIESSTVEGDTFWPPLSVPFSSHWATPTHNKDQRWRSGNRQVLYLSLLQQPAQVERAPKGLPISLPPVRALDGPPHQHLGTTHTHTRLTVLGHDVGLDRVSSLVCDRFECHHYREAIIRAKGNEEKWVKIYILRCWI